MSATSHRVVSAALLAVALGSGVGSVARGEELRVRGELRVVGGGAASGVPVRLLPYADSYQRRLIDLGDATLPAAVASSTSGTDGTFELALPSLGPWWLVLGLPDELLWRHDLLPNNEDRWLEPFDLPTASTLVARVLDEKGAPLAGALVVVDVEPVRGHRWGRYRPLRQSVRTDAEGRATLWSVAGARSKVYAASPGRLPELAALEPGAPLEAELRLIANKPVELRARLSSGAPAVRAVVRVGESMVAIGLTDDEGKIVVARPLEDEISYQIETETLDYGSVTVAAAGSGPSTVVLEPPITLTGSIRETGTGRPVPGAVAWFWHRPSDHGVSGRDGVWEMRAWSAEQELSLQIGATGHSPTGLRLGEILRVGGDVPPIYLHPVVEVTGRVVGRDGEPIAGAMVAAQAAVSGEVYRSADARTRSADDGSFRFRALPPDGGLALEVVHADYAVLRSDLGSVRVAASGPPLEIVLDRGREAVGTVLGAGDEPVAGAAVELLRVGAQSGLLGGRMVGPGDQVGLAVTADAAGSFRIPRTPMGRFDLAVRAPGYAPTLVPGVEVPAGEGAHELGTVTLEPGLALDGKVVGDSGHGLAGARVELRTAADRSSPAGAETRSGADGSFQFCDLRRGEEVSLFVELEGWTQTQEATVRVPADVVRVVLEPASRIRGRLLTTDGAGVKGAMIHARAAPESFGLGNLPGRRNARSEEGGRFELLLPPGKWQLMVRAGGGLTGSRHVDVAAGETLDLVIELSESVMVVGTITDPHGNTLAGAAIHLEIQKSSGGSTSSGGGRSDAAGRYRVSIDELGSLRRQDSQGDRYAITVRHEDFRPVRREFEPQPGEVRIDVQLERGLEVSGLVVGPDGAPVVGAAVSAHQVGDGVRAVMRMTDRAPPRSDSGGRFTLRGLDSDTTYDLHATAAGFAAASPVRVELGVSGVGDVVIELGQSITLSGVVRGLSVEELAQVGVRAHSVEASGGTRFDVDRYSARPDFEGRFEIADLGPGRWQVIAETQGVASGRRVHELVDVVAGESPFVELGFGEGFTVSGLVRVDGEPAPGFRVFVVGGQGSSPSQTMTDVNGQFRAEGVLPGEVRILIHRAGSNHQERVLVEGDTEVLIDLRLARLSGHVVATTGEPIGGARVMATSGGTTPEDMRFAASGESAADGSFSLELDEGRYTLAVSRAGFAGETTTVDFQAGGIAGILVELEPAAEVILAATLPSGAPAGTLWVMRTPGMGASGRVSSFDQVETEALGGGRFAVRSLGPGTWELLVASQSTTFERVTVTAPGPPVTVVLRAGGMLQVTAPSFANSAAHLELYGPSGARYEFPLTSAPRLEGDQGFVPNVPVGPWRVRVVAADGRVAEVDVVVQAGATAVAEIP